MIGALIAALFQITGAVFGLKEPFFFPSHDLDIKSHGLVP
jgi:hypothetical protein